MHNEKYNTAFLELQLLFLSFTDEKLLLLYRISFEIIFV